MRSPCKIPLPVFESLGGGGQPPIITNQVSFNIFSNLNLTANTREPVLLLNNSNHFEVVMLSSEVFTKQKMPSCSNSIPWYDIKKKKQKNSSPSFSCDSNISKQPEYFAQIVLFSLQICIVCSSHGFKSLYNLCHFSLDVYGIKRYPTVKHKILCLCTIKLYIPMAFTVIKKF